MGFEGMMGLGIFQYLVTVRQTDRPHLGVSERSLKMGNAYSTLGIIFYQMNLVESEIGCC